MSVTAVVASGLKVTETITTNTPAASDANARVVHDQFDEVFSLTGASSVPATKVAAFEQALAAGSATIDLTALSGTNAGTVDLTGLKVQAIKCLAPDTNSAAITLAEGLSNGYELAGDSWAIDLAPGQSVLFYGAESAPDVGSTAKTIDLTGTGTDAVQVIVVAG